MAENNKKFDNKNTNEETQQQKRCFVIMPFSDPEGYAPGHFRKVYEQIIKPAVENAGYEAYRVDENGVSDLITTKIFKAILDCDMAICDLSSRNPNVLYELGIRHAFDKPVVLIKDNKTDRIFDIQGISTVEYRRERIYDEVIEDQKKISEAIRANENNSSGYSILNMINLPKATYDTNTKDSDSPEFNKALLMRVLDALDKVEKKQNYFGNLTFNSSHTNKTPDNLFSYESYTAEPIIHSVKSKVFDLSSEVDFLNSPNIIPDPGYVSTIESQILEVQSKVMKIKLDGLSDKQLKTINNCSIQIESMLDRIQKIKANFNNS